jgi:hypothetical protein
MQARAAMNGTPKRDRRIGAPFGTTIQVESQDKSASTPLPMTWQGIFSLRI